MNKTVDPAESINAFNRGVLDGVCCTFAANAEIHGMLGSGNHHIQMREIATIAVSRLQQAKWKRGELAHLWAARYPELFDTDDLRLAINQCRLGYHFFEWLGAIVLHGATGFHALVAKYEFKNHRRKREVLEKLLPPEVIELLRDRDAHGRAQAPDLLMYAPGETSYYFCEVKGPTDRVQEAQQAKFEALSRLTGQPVCLLRFSWL